jgi:type IV secretory pathway VirB10-like protein
MSKGKSNDLLIAGLGLGVGGLLTYLLWPRDAAASTIQGTPLAREDESPVQRAQQTMREVELPSKPAPKPAAPKPAPAKKPAKPAPKVVNVDDQIAQMRAAVQQFEMERSPDAALAMKKQLAQVLKAEADRAELSRDQMRANALREQLTALQL